MDEDRAAPQDRKPFENLQNALQCVIRSFVESPQVMNNTNSLSLPCFLPIFLHKRFFNLFVMLRSSH